MTEARDLREPILPDDYPIHGDYLYVADGKVVRSDWHGITARQFRHKLGANELRECDICGRKARAEAKRLGTDERTADAIAWLMTAYPRKQDSGA